jgi:hypothetical protein
MVIKNIFNYSTEISVAEDTEDKQCKLGEFCNLIFSIKRTSLFEIFWEVILYCQIKKSKQIWTLMKVPQPKIKIEI